MRNPQFNQLRAEMDGFIPCEGLPSKENVQAFMEFICSGIEEAREGELDTWDDLLDLAYSKLAFFRVYYCGEDPGKMPKFLKHYPPAAARGMYKRVRPSGSDS